MSMLKKFWKDEAGLETLEYAIIASVIVLALIGIMSGIGNKILNKFTGINAQLPAN